MMESQKKVTSQKSESNISGTTLKKTKQKQKKNTRTWRWNGITFSVHYYSLFPEFPG